MAHWLSLYSSMNKLLYLLSFLVWTVAWSDKIKTIDGSILQGEIIGMLDGNLTILTTYAGTLKIPEHQISAISSAEVQLSVSKTFGHFVCAEILDSHIVVNFPAP